MHADNKRTKEESVAAKPLPQQILGKEDYMPSQTSARTRCAEARHFQNGNFRRPGLHRVGDVGKELTKDAELKELVDMEIPRLVTPTERSSDLVETEVRAKLSDLLRQKEYYIMRI